MAIFFVRKKVSTFIKRTLAFLLVFLVMIMSVASLGPTMTVHASSTVTYDSWLEGWDTGDTYDGLTTFIDDDEDVAGDSDWLSAAIEAAVAFLIKSTVGTIIIAFVDNMGATVENVVYGRVGTGSTNYFQFGLEDGNVYGVIGSIMYALFRNLIFGFFAIQFMWILGSYLLKGTGKGRSDLKGSIYNFVFMFVLLYAIPILVDFMIYIRDVLLKQVARLSVSITGSYNLGVTDAIIIETADDWTIFGAILLCCACAAGVYFAIDYLKRAVSQIYLFGVFPVVAYRSFTDKQILNKWVGQFIVSLFVPLFDAIGLWLVILVQNYNSAATDNGPAILGLIVYMSIIPCRNLVMQLFGMPMPGKGFSLMTAAVMMMRGFGKSGNNKRGGENSGDGANKAPTSGSGNEKSALRREDDVNASNSLIRRGEDMENGQDRYGASSTRDIGEDITTATDNKGMEDAESSEGAFSKKDDSASETGAELETSGGSDNFVNNVNDADNTYSFGEGITEEYVPADFPLGQQLGGAVEDVVKDVEQALDGGHMEMPELNNYYEEKTGLEKMDEVEKLAGESVGADGPMEYNGQPEAEQEEFSFASDNEEVKTVTELDDEKDKEVESSEGQTIEADGSEVSGANKSELNDNKNGNDSLTHAEPLGNIENASLKNKQDNSKDSIIQNTTESITPSSKPSAEEIGREIGALKQQYGINTGNTGLDASSGSAKSAEERAKAVAKKYERVLANAGGKVRESAIGAGRVAYDHRPLKMRRTEDGEIDWKAEGQAVKDTAATTVRTSARLIGAGVAASVMATSGEENQVAAAAMVGDGLVSAVADSVPVQTVTQGVEKQVDKVADKLESTTEAAKKREWNKPENAGERQKFESHLEKLKTVNEDMNKEKKGTLPAEKNKQQANRVLVHKGATEVSGAPSTHKNKNDESDKRERAIDSRTHIEESVRGLYQKQEGERKEETIDEKEESNEQ